MEIEPSGVAAEEVQELVDVFSMERRRHLVDGQILEIQEMISSACQTFPLTEIQQIPPWQLPALFPNLHAPKNVVEIFG